jgi:hypothetical protein
MAGPADDVRSLGAKRTWQGSCDRNDLPELMIEWTKHHQFGSAPRLRQLTFVPKVENCENDQRADQNSHLISPSPSAPIERTLTFVGKHGDLIAHFDESHFDQGPEIVRADRHKFGPLAFDIAQHPA